VLYIPRLPSSPSNSLDARVLLAALALVAGCSSGSRPDVSEAGVSNACIQALCTPDPNGVCQHTCASDPGPALVDCAAAEANYVFDAPIWTFDPPDGGNTSMGLARGMYSYTDNSTVIQTFKRVNNQTGLVEQKTWEPPTAVLPRCSDRPDPMNRAIHIQGGPFLSWGGGVGIGMKNLPQVTGSVGLAAAMQDKSEWEGISFWARRGPDSQVGFRVLVGDKNTDDDISYIMYRDTPNVPRYCERVRECACLNHRSCVAVHLDKNAAGLVTNPEIPNCQLAPDPNAQFMSFCGTPETINGAESSATGGSQCNTCFETRCNERYPAFPDDCGVPGGNCPGNPPPRPAGTDPQFYGKPCSPYTMRNGISSYWCFDPAAGEHPAETTEQCGDHWTRVVNLSNEWQFYTVPFNQMAQQGWAKRSAALDTTAVSVVRFTWDGGWIDYWIDDVRFYKRKSPTP